MQGSVRGISSKDVFACVRLLPVYVKLFCLVMSPYDVLYDDVT